MTLSKKYESDIAAIIAKRYNNGDDLWTTPDKKISKGSPFSTLESAIMQSELGESSTALLKEAAGLMFGLWREDGRFQTSPNGAIYPCQTAGVARVLCCLGYERYHEILNNLKNRKVKIRR